MNTAASRERERTVPVREIVTNIVRAAVRVTPINGDPAGRLTLMLRDIHHHDDTTAVVTVIVTDALNTRGWLTTANRWRPLIPTWVQPRVIGAVVNAMITIGVLVPTGRWVISTDLRGGNRGKPQRVYRLRIRPRDLLAPPPRGGT